MGKINVLFAASFRKTKGSFLEKRRNRYFKLGLWFVKDRMVSDMKFNTVNDYRFGLDLIFVHFRIELNKGGLYFQ